MASFRFSKRASTLFKRAFKRACSAAALAAASASALALACCAVTLAAAASALDFNPVFDWWVGGRHEEEEKEEGDDAAAVEMATPAMNSHRRIGYLDLVSFRFVSFRFGLRLMSDLRELWPPTEASVYSRLRSP